MTTKETTMPETDRLPRKLLAWHFTADTLRDGRPIPPVGEWLHHDGPVEMCRSGLHASTRVFDALKYAPGNLLHRVEVAEVIERSDDKLVCRSRRIVRSLDAEALLRAFARRCALDVVHLWEPPAIVVQYLKTGDESIRDAARDAAWDAAGAAAWDAARDAARAAGWDAAWDAARDAAWAAAWDAAWDAACAAARARQSRRLTAMVAAALRSQEDA